MEGEGSKHLFSATKCWAIFQCSVNDRYNVLPTQSIFVQVLDVNPHGIQRWGPCGLPVAPALPLQHMALSLLFCVLNSLLETRIVFFFFFFFSLISLVSPSSLPSRQGRCKNLIWQLSKYLSTKWQGLTCLLWEHRAHWRFSCLLSGLNWYLIYYGQYLNVRTLSDSLIFKLIFMLGIRSSYIGSAFGLRLSLEMICIETLYLCFPWCRMGIFNLYAISKGQW